MTCCYSTKSLLLLFIRILFDVYGIHNVIYILSWKKVTMAGK